MYVLYDQENIPRHTEEYFSDMIYHVDEVMGIDIGDVDADVDEFDVVDNYGRKWSVRYSEAIVFSVDQVRPPLDIKIEGDE